ncbi:MAG: protein kinase [Proteobacteria bacterium]|nr:protein kinase [Pseudomonadota bacterium]
MKDIAGYSGQIPVAVKTLTSRDQDVIRKFHEEAELMKKFSHPNIVSLLGKRTARMFIGDEEYCLLYMVQGLSKRRKMRTVLL